MKVPRLRAIREQKVLTQHDLAAKAGVSRSAIARIELGGDSYPATIRKLAQALGVEPTELVRP